jgi:hypothetical protein
MPGVSQKCEVLGTKKSPGAMKVAARTINRHR